MADAQIAIIDGDQTQVVLAPGENPAIVTSIPGPQGPAGAGVPTGGATNEVLYKLSSTFGDTAWGPITSAMIGDLQIVNADVSASAAIAGTKISPNFGSQNVTTTGTSTAASFIPTSSTAPTNGLYLSAANSVALSTNGTGRLFVDASGNVLIGATGSASRLLTVNQTGTTAGEYGIRVSQQSATSNAIDITIDSANGVSKLFQKSTIPLVFGTNDTERLRITSTGQLSHIGAGSSGSPAVSFSGSAGSNSLVVDSSSRVGIGTSAPSTTLHCATNNSSTSVGTSTLTAILQNSNATSGAINGLGFANSGGFYSAAIYTTQAQTGNSGDNLVLNTKTSGGAWNTGVVIDTAGRVGIGSTSPSALLTAGAAYGGTPNIQTVAVIQSATNTYVTVGAGSSSQAGILFADTAANNAGGMLYSHSTDSLEFLAGGNEAARFDSSRRLLVGTSSAASNVYVKGDLASSAATTPVQQLAVSSANYNGASIISYNASGYAGTLSLASSKNNTIGANTSVGNSQAVGVLSFSGNDGANFIPCAEIKGVVDGTPGANDMPGRLVFSTTADGASSPTERMRIQSDGDVLIGRTSELGSVHRLVIERDNLAVGINTFNGGNNEAVRFYNAGTAVGTISTTGSATAYNTSSDYRLKENVVAVTDGITRLQQLKPSRFNFIADPAKTVDGFLAHEVQNVVPEAITGEKDAVDDEGNPQYQGIDQSKLVPLLTAALQEAIGEIESLKARLDAANL